jgi:streptogramin lyase
MEVKILEFKLPHVDSGPYGITFGSDGTYWFTEQRGNRIGRMTADGKRLSGWLGMWFRLGDLVRRNPRQ